MMEKKKIYLVPAYFYLSMPDFEKVIRELGNEAELFVVAIREDADKITAYGYDNHYFEEKNLHLLEVLLPSAPNVRRSWWAGKIAHLRQHWHNFSILNSFLCRYRPDIVVVSSDLGHANIRFLIEHCLTGGIPVIIFWTCDIEVPVRHPILDRLNSFLFFFRASVFRFLRAYLFRGNITGTFAMRSPIVLISETGRQKLIAYGIPEDRISVVKSLPEEEQGQSMLRSELGIASDSSVIIFYTEFIQKIYGMDYVHSLHQELAGMFKRLCSAYNVSVIIRPHPRDLLQFPDQYDALIRCVFSDASFKIVNDKKAEDLIAISDINIAHYSKVLMTAAIMKKRFISINFRNDRIRTFVPETESSILEASSCGDLEDRIVRLIAGDPYGEMVDRAIKNFSRDRSDTVFRKQLGSVIEELLRQTESSSSKITRS